jgi:hypothetical protein
MSFEARRPDINFSSYPEYCEYSREDSAKELENANHNA